uniref:Uncharacterized protein n=1 Tax=Pyrodinium bahamense TaxID=73915 RepID=A0A7S0B7C0_9DINO|mmetsp:Transcript_53171/g.147308  ORF Transcript_53171/g.147308 Transcript_53171/m.147308 type:complete len:554 (+) Transcript_53171:66-1727(+)
MGHAAAPARANEPAVWHRHFARARQQRQQQLRPRPPYLRPLQGRTVAPAVACAAVSTTVRRRTWGQLSPGLRNRGWAGLCSDPARAAAEAAETVAVPAGLRPTAASLAIAAFLLLSLLHRRLLRALAANGAPAPPVGLVAAVHAVVFLAALLASHRPSGPRGSPQGGPGRARFALVAAVVVAEVLSWMALGGLAAAGSPALAVALLSGSAVPYVMSLSGVLLRRRFEPLAWAGALLVAAGVACCSLGALPTIRNAAQAALLAGAFAVPGLAMVGREALLKGSHSVGLAAGALLLSVAQLAATLLSQSWTPAWAALVAPLYSSGAAGLWLYIAVSGALRVSLVWALRASSASSVQLANALAVPLGAASLAPASARNLSALVLSTAGATLYCWARLGQPQATAGLAQAELSLDARAKKTQMTFLEELKAAQQEEQMEKLRREEEAARRLAMEQRKEERLKRLKERWLEEEGKQTMKEGGQQNIEVPRMYAQEEIKESSTSNAGAPREDDVPLTSAEIKQIEMDEAYLGSMWKKWMLENPAEWRRQETAARQGDTV